MSINDYIGNIVHHPVRNTFYTIVSAATFNASDDDCEIFDRKPVFFYLDLSGEAEPQARLASEMLDGRFNIIYRGKLRLRSVSKSNQRHMRLTHHNGPHDTLKHLLSKFSGSIEQSRNEAVVTFNNATSANVATSAVNFINEEERIMTALAAYSRMKQKRLDTFDCFFGAMMYLDMHWIDAAMFASAATDPNSNLKAKFENPNHPISFSDGMSIILKTWSHHFP